MKPVLICLILLTMAAPSVGKAATATLIKNAIGCRHIGIFAVASTYNQEGDPVAAKQSIRMAIARGECKILRKGTKVIFHHLAAYTDGDWGDKTTVREVGKPGGWILDKCALDSRDPDIEKFRSYLLPEPVCEEESAHE